MFALVLVVSGITTHHTVSQVVFDRWGAGYVETTLQVCQGAQLSFQWPHGAVIVAQRCQADSIMVSNFEK